LKSYEASATIAAPPEAVWEILVDGPAYTQWDSGVLALDGAIAPGQRLKVTSEANPGRAFGVRVTEMMAARSMRWSGGMPLGLFRGERTFTLRPRGDAGTDFLLREEYSGPMLGLIWRSMPDLGPSFEKFARGLKERAENGA
jgi:hypothetical protein